MTDIDGLLAETDRTLGVPEQSAVSENGAAPTTARPTIMVRGELSRVSDEAEAALLADADAGIFVRGRLLVRVTRDEGKRRAGLLRSAGAPVIEPLPLDALRKRIDEAADWVRWDERRKKEVRALPPDWVARTIMAADHWRFPYLEGVVEAPIITPDGAVLERPGYDPASGLMVAPDIAFPAVPLDPGAAELVGAHRLLREPLHDFPFVADSDRAAAVAAILTLVGRPAITGCCPLFAVRATAPGTGKGLLADTVSIIGAGRPAARMALPPDEESLRKAILALAIEGAPGVLLDNISRPLGSSTLSAALTAETWKDRLLGVSRTVEAPLRAVWLATGNNLVFKGDLGRRVVPIDLDAKAEHPEDRADWRYTDLVGWVRDHRADLVVAALTILRGYHVAGRPAHGCGPRKGSFEAWDDLIRGACVWAELGDPLAGCERIRREDDSDVAALRAALVAWREMWDQPRTAAEAVGEANRRADPKTGPDGGDAGLRDALLGLTPYRDKLTPGHLGYALRGARGRIVDGLCFKAAKGKRGVNGWVVEGEWTGECGDSGDSGDGSSYCACDADAFQEGV